MSAFKKQTQQVQRDNRTITISSAPLKSRKEIAEELGVSVKTLNKYLKEADVSLPKGLIRPAFQALIYQKILNVPKISD
jgi:transcriptional regulator with XRE-family HTH domain